MRVGPGLTRGRTRRHRELSHAAQLERAPLVFSGFSAIIRPVVAIPSC